MITKPEEVRALASDLTTSAWTLAAIGFLFESGLVDRLREPRSIDDLAAECPSIPRERIARCVEVAAGVGLVVTEDARYHLAPGAMPFLGPPMRTALEGEIRSHVMQPLAYLDSARSTQSSSGWRHTNNALLVAQGDASAVFPPMLKMNIVPSLGDLAARLDRKGARFLDVGVGVASLAIAMCRAWPELHVVGLDTYDVARTIAQQNIARAKMQERIELCDVAVEDLRQEASFDLAWLPSVFIARASMKAAAARVSAALRPGGWILFPIANPSAPDRMRACFALVTELWGGPTMSPAEAESILKEAGLTAIRALPGPAWAPTMMVGQRLG